MKTVLLLDSDTFRNVIINRRLKLGLTQAELSDISGVSQPIISKIESHQVKLNLFTLSKILNSLDYSIELIDNKKY